MVYDMNTRGKSAFWLGVARLSSGLKLGEEPFPLWLKPWGFLLPVFEPWTRLRESHNHGGSLGILTDAYETGLVPRTHLLESSITNVPRQHTDFW